MRALVLVALLAGCAAGAADRVGYAPVHGLRMYFEEHGRGRPLVLLHGGGSTVETSFGAILPRLAQRHRVIAPEQQAHGHTADIDRPLSFEQMADDTAALLEQLGVRDADVIGFSNGGRVALELAIRHPELVRRLVVCSSFYAHAGLAPSLREAFHHATAESMPASLRAAYLGVAPHPEALPTLIAKTVAMMLSFRDLSEAELRAIQAPALVMVGDADVVSVEHEAALARLLPHAQLAVLPGSGHGTYLGVAETAQPGSKLPDIGLALIEAFLE